MNKIIFLLLFGLNLSSQHTFSIVAIDPVTGEIGSAGATCLDGNSPNDGAYIISDIVVGKGAVHTQSYWHAGNQKLANTYLKDGLPATDIVSLLASNDVQGTPTVRQYGAVTFAGLVEERSAGYTGINCFDVKKHRVGNTFAIQGNILINEGVIDSMYERFVNTPGPLFERLMAAMQGAKVPGADSRCLNEGVSSLSAFIRVSRPGDADDDLWMDLNVGRTPFGIEPIDSLQKLVDGFVQTSSLIENESSLNLLRITPSPNNGNFDIEFPEVKRGFLTVIDSQSKQVYHSFVNGKIMKIDISNNPSGFYFIYLINLDSKQTLTGKIILEK